MIVQSMTHAEVYRELEADMANVGMWWLTKRKTQMKIAKWTTKLPRTSWFEYTSARNNRYLVYNVILGHDYNNDSLTGVIALRKEAKGYTVYVSRLPWQTRTRPQVFLPHVFDQYADPKRGNVNKTGIELIKHFMERNNHGEISHDDKFFGRSVRYKGRDNAAKSISDGVLLGEFVDDIFVAHTFITYDMAAGLQREEFEGKRKCIIDNSEFTDRVRRENREEELQMRAELKRVNS